MGKRGKTVFDIFLFCFQLGERSKQNPETKFCGRVKKYRFLLKITDIQIKKF
jgi:hypothetical protein